MASTETYTSEQELRNLYKGLKEEQLINMLINQHHTIRELSKNITVTHCCKSDSKLFNCGKQRVYGEERCNRQCDICYTEYNDN